MLGREILQQLANADAASIESNLAKQWDETAGWAQERFVLHGAGILGRDTIRRMRAANLRPVAVCDNKNTLWGTEVEGELVVSPEDAVHQWGQSAVFVVSTYNPSKPIEVFRELGVRTAVSWTRLYNAYSDRFLPYWGFPKPAPLGDVDDALRADALWADERSRQVYRELLSWRATLDSSALSSPEPLEDLYFSEGIIDPEEYTGFIDCGAYDGDTFTTYLERCRYQCRRADLIEPDPGNMTSLLERVSALPPSIREVTFVHSMALGGTTGNVQMLANAGVDSQLVSTGGNVTTELQRLDDVVEVVWPTLIKVDVEGGERGVISGAREICKTGRATWAVAGYHRPSDLWDLPILLSSMGYEELYLRKHAEDCWETCIYAIPSK